MRNMDLDSSLERMKELYKHGDQDAKLKSNISETVEYKVDGPNGKTYGIVRESQKYFIKESSNGAEFNYIGGIGNKSDNEYPSYNSAQRNLELKIREMNASKNTGKVFESFKPAEQAEYIVEATEDMRKELDRFKQITNGAQSIMKESSTEFINKPKFKDPEGFGTATDPKKQGAPFTDDAKASLDKDPKASSKTPKTAGAPFEGEAKSDEDKFDIEKTNNTPAKAGDPFTTPAKDVLGNSVATQNPKGGKVFRVTEAQLAQVKKYMTEAYYEDEPEESEILKQFNYDLDSLEGGRKYKPSKLDLADTTNDDTEEVYSDSNPLSRFKDDGLDDIDDDLVDSEDDLEEGFWDTIKGVGKAGSALGGAAKTGVKQGVQNVGQAIGDKFNTAKQGVQNAYGNVKNIANTAYNQSQQNSSASKIQQLASNLKSEIDNLNARTVKGGGQPLNVNSVISIISNQLRGNKGVDTSRFRAEGNEPEMDENLVNKITEAVLSAFGQHPQYQKAAFTTPTAKENTPYGTKIGSSAPFTQSVKQKVGEGEIAEDADSVQQGKTPQAKPSLGKKGDVAPFTKPVEKSGDDIAKGTPVQKGETQQAKPSLGKKGDKAPFDKPVKKEDVLNKLAESIIADLRKKVNLSEVSSSLANRATNKAFDVATDNMGDDPIKASVKRTQAKSFGQYVNPDLQSYAQRNGLLVVNSPANDNLYIEIQGETPNDLVKIVVEPSGRYKIIAGTIHMIPPEKQKAVSVLINKIKSDLNHSVSENRDSDFKKKV